MMIHRILLAVRFAVVSTVLCWVLTSCRGVFPWATSELAGQPSPAASRMPRRVVTPQTNPSMSSPFWLEDTQVRVHAAGLVGRANVAWSHKGDWLAYRFGESLWLVQDNQWSNPREAYAVGSDAGPLSMEDGHLAWSPDDATVGLTLGRNVGSREVPSEFYLGQVGREHRVLSYLSLDRAVLIDWSPANRIVAFRDYGWWIYDVASLKWDHVVIPESISNKYYLRASQWTSGDSMLWLGATDPYGKGTFQDFAVLSLDWLSGLWEILPPHINSADVLLPYPVTSPDGRWIAWIEDRILYSRLMLYDTETSEQIQAANSLDYGQVLWGDLTWAPDSRRLAFSSARAGDEAQSHNIWILHLEPLK
jgi:hypothetical protein